LRRTGCGARPSFPRAGIIGLATRGPINVLLTQ
jgi:hypothetical protein